MGFFKKEMKPETRRIELPMLPEEDSTNLPLLPELPETDEISQKPLPQLPKAQNNNSNIQAIKENIEYQKSSGYEIHKLDNPPEIRSYEVDSPQIMNTSENKTNQISSLENKPIFVKIDKFKDAAAKFEEIKTRIYEIESSLNKIKQVKQEEEQELKTWEDEIKSVKEKISNIDSSLFSKI